MSPTRRDVLRSVAGVAVALPLATLPQVAPQAAAAVPSHWNTVQTDPIPEHGHRTPESWNADATMFVYSKDLNRYVARQLHFKAYTDGSSRLCIGTADVFNSLPVEKGFSAIYLDPTLSQELYQGLFAESPADVMPVEEWRRREWSDEQYIWHQQQMLWMRDYRRKEEDRATKLLPLTPFDDSPLLDYEDED